MTTTTNGPVRLVPGWCLSGTKPTNEQAWSLLGENYATLKKYSRCMCPDWTQSEDFLDDVVLDVHDAMVRGLYDPGRGPVGPWIYTRVQLTRIRWIRRARRRQAERPLIDIQIPRCAINASPWGAVEGLLEQQAVARLTVQRLLDTATDDEFEIVTAALLGWDNATTQRLLGISPRKRRARMREFKDRVRAEHSNR